MIPPLNPFVAWQSRLPRVYRYLEECYVDEFFSLGKLRLSSFRKFALHADEQRLDGEEGTDTVIHRTSAGGGQTLAAKVEVGRDAYVLCGSLTPSMATMKSFHADSAIVVRDVRGFAAEVAKHLPRFKTGFDGPCSYQQSRIIERGDLGNLDLGETEPGQFPAHWPKGARRPVLPVVLGIAGRDAYFLKHHRFAEQNEWRLVWLVSGEAKEHIDLVVPEARKFCSPWCGSGTLVAY